MALNLRKITPALHAKLKSNAAGLGRTIEDHCIDILLAAAFPEAETLAPKFYARREGEPKVLISSPEPEGMGSCIHGFNTRKFCITMKGGCK